MVGGFPALLNNESYNKLPEDIQQIVDELADPMERTIEICEAWEAFNADSIVELKAFDEQVGNPEWYVLPEAERQRWLEVVWPINDAFIAELEEKGLPGEEFLADTIAFAEQYK
jgi:TRAP-type C4-dicarboxylate transport system substrate-binding protein